ncbi:glycosyltransferase [Chlorogloeopsis sp. ULAP01]|uniref:glycosyltransferase family 2 protein n=1 Tax=Chlorogloeopsis sp. ULAP01 TaxID=3056483 RepID=UPI0025AAC653|nr:glycosyltransferase [Chlorogloeopsis sp. ULAP01]MDM9382073.1 glycosyltransferase [Chlorogloeopsis sp. ULAP01]
MAQELPLFSIIIPTYNRPERLATCLESLVRLESPRNGFEVIVVDDGSKVALEPVAARFQAQLNLKLLKQVNAGPAKARNTGAVQAQGKFLAFTDDDCMPAPDWLTNLAARFAMAEDSMIGGQTLNALPENLYSTASQVLIDYLYKYYNTSSHPVSFFASNNLALPAVLFHALGGFDTTFPLAAGEDREFCDRWLHHGYQMIYAPEVHVYHAHKLTLSTFWRQHFNYGRGAFCFHTRRSQRTEGRIKVEPLKFYFNLLAHPLLQKSSQPGILVSVLFVVSQVANVAGFFWERLTQPTQQFN